MTLPPWPLASADFFLVQVEQIFATAGIVVANPTNGIHRFAVGAANPNLLFHSISDQRMHDRPMAVFGGIQHAVAIDITRCLDFGLQFLQVRRQRRGFFAGGVLLAIHVLAIHVRRVRGPVRFLFLPAGRRRGRLFGPGRRRAGSRQRLRIRSGRRGRCGSGIFRGLGPRPRSVGNTRLQRVVNRMFGSLRLTAHGSSTTPA